MSETTNTPPEKKELSKEEMKEMRSKMIAHYKEEIKLLKPQEEYERLIADIEEHKLRAYLSMHKSSQIYAALQDEENKEHQAKEGASEPERKLATP